MSPKSTLLDSVDRLMVFTFTFHFYLYFTFFVITVILLVKKGLFLFLNKNPLCNSIRLDIKTLYT